MKMRSGLAAVVCADGLPRRAPARASASMSLGAAAGGRFTRGGAGTGWAPRRSACGKGWAFRARSMSSASGQRGAWASAMPAPSNPSAQAAAATARISVRAGTAVPLAEDLVREVLARDRVRLARAPDHRRAAVGLTALAGFLRGGRYRVDHLQLVVGLVH